MCRRIIIVAISLFASTGCAVLRRAENAMELLATANQRLAEANQRMAEINQRLDMVQAKLDETSRKIDDTQAGRDEPEDRRYQRGPRPDPSEARRVEAEHRTDQ
jgi:peptidoglycan hydrolase CwlO-like protein